MEVSPMRRWRLQTNNISGNGKGLRHVVTAADIKGHLIDEINVKLSCQGYRLTLTYPFM